MRVEFIAKCCHEINRVYCESIGDTSQPTWEDAPYWQRESAVQGVKYVIDNPNVTPEDQHDNWMKVKIDDGWTFGPVKDPERKEHPCLVPYHLLPEQQQAKDKFFQTVVQLLK